MELFAFSGLINGIVALLFGGLVFYKDWKNRQNQIFFLMTLSVAFWAFSYWMWLSSTVEIDALFWTRILALGSMFIPLFFFHWVTKLLNIAREKRWIIKASYALVVIFSLFAFSPLVIQSVTPKLIFNFWPNPGILYGVYLLLIYIGLVSYALVLLKKHYHDPSTNRDMKGQIIYVILGVIFGFGGGLTNFPLWYGIPLLPYGNIAVVLFPFFLGYAALKHSLFSIKVIATEMLTFAVWIFVLLRLLLSDSARDQMVDGVLLILLIGAGYLLIKSVRKEVKTREKVEKLAEDLEKANVRLKELDRQKTQFLSIASHQFRSPLTAIKGYASLILEGSFGAIAPKVKEPIENILKSSENLVLTVEDFLNISRIEQGRMKYNFENANVGEMVKEIIEEQRPVVEEKGLKLDIKISSGEKFMSKIDVGKMHQVVINLIDNAAKYTPSGSVTVGVDKSHGKILISIKDTGVGIEKENLDKLFRMFSRMKNAHKVNVSGTGLGLYVAKQMVEAHKGRIWAESEGKGKGATFFVELDEL